MLYKRHPNSNRKHMHSNSGTEVEAKKPEAIKAVSNIPLPNESEDITEQPYDTRGHSALFIDIFKNRIYLDEIILVGLIFLLFQEGIEDEFLLIILVYILIAGRL